MSPELRTSSWLDDEVRAPIAKVAIGGEHLLAAHGKRAHIYAHGQPQSYVHLRSDLRGDRKQRSLQGTTTF